MLNFLEKETKYDKGKGEKSSSFLSVHDDIDEKDIDKFTKSGEEEAPKLILFFKGEDTLEMSVIATDTCRIFCQADTVPDAVMMLLASYYVFDLDYPRKYTQCLGFLQQVVIGDAYTGIKSTKFKHFMKKFKSDSE
ncbi:hypothetical protein FSP39_002173 [Pinctada imbricata]|uniref:Uncharacterized protein n=1 Tax=Pinctada imbricata TaxID=66713 RepID=A0AA89BWN9_PINIB|nr:hypothetical protein FSP39_002173 [Pinctada imbricata]